MAPFLHSSPRRGVAAVRMFFGVFAAVLLMAGTAQAAGPSSPLPLSPIVANLSATNATPLRSVRVFRIYGWRYLEPHSAVLWLGVDEPYLLSVRGDCPDFDQSLPSVLAVRDTHLVPGRDRLQFSSGACVIDSLVRADRNKLRANLITPDATNAIRLIQDATPQRKPR